MRAAGPMNIRVRGETPADVRDIEALTAAAFLHAPHTSHTEQYVINALRAAGQLTLSLVAQQGDTLIGHVALSPVSICDGTPGWFGLGPLSVLPQHQRRGVGTRLVHEALRTLRECRACGCVVLGDPEYYGRFGFLAAPGLILPAVPVQYFQATSFGSSRPRGTVTYHAAFAQR